MQRLASKGKKGDEEVFKAKRLADLQEQPKKSTGKPDFYLSPPRASVYLSRSGLKAKDKRVDLESAKRLNEADKRLMQTLRGVMKEKEREKMKEVLLAKKRREVRLRAGMIRGV